MWPQGACLEDTRVSTSRRDILFRQKHHHKTSRSHTWRPETGRWADTWHWQICHPCITPTQPLPLLASSPVAGAAACTPCPAGSYTAATGAVDVSSDVASERRSCGTGRMRISCARLEREHQAGLEQAAPHPASAPHAPPEHTTGPLVRERVCICVYSQAADI